MPHQQLCPIRRPVVPLLEANFLEGQSLSLIIYSGSTSFASSASSTTNYHSLNSTTPTPAPGPSAPPPLNHRLSNGAVAGTVIAVALGLALLTFLATFIFMRRKQYSKSKRTYRTSGQNRGLEMNTPRHRDSTTERTKKPTSTETSGASATYEHYLPQSADDRTVQQRTKSTLDQIELHIENFYRNSSSSTIRPDNAEVAVFDSPYLPAPLASLLPRSKNRVNIIKHVLAQSITSSISPSAGSARSLLPTEYAIPPNTVSSAEAGRHYFIACKATDCPKIANSMKGSPR